ncbi:ArsR/SmtB family transcription factor [Cohnella sp. GCM10012308]|uniref:ArsR/SmtB family transcription factor n=1 Tax=Cohnella sp. GCM10012308 TaxID=3317329 RepID=UPI0036142FC0
MKPLFHPDTADIQLSSVLYALSDPVRLMLVYKLRQNGERACGDIELPIAKSTVSHHSRTLREAGVVRTRAHGTQRLLSLREEDLEARFPGLLNAVLASYEETDEL